MLAVDSLNGAASGTVSASTSGLLAPPTAQTAGPTLAWWDEVPEHKRAATVVVLSPSEPSMKRSETTPGECVIGAYVHGNVACAHLYTCTHTHTHTLTLRSVSSSSFLNAS